MISFIVRRILRLILNGKEAQNPGKVCLPTGVLITSCICTPLLLVFSVLCFVLENILWGAILFFILALFSAMLAVAYFNIQFTYTNDGFTARSFWGRKKTFSYDQITAIKRHPTEFRLYMENEEVCVEYVLIGSHDFLAQVEQSYQVLHHGAEIPLASKKENDIFLGNSPDKGVSFIVGYLMCLAAVAGAFGFLVCVAVKSGNPRSIWIYLITATVFIIGWIVYGVFSIRAGRDPEKYEKVLWLFFKKGYINVNKKIEKRK